MQCQNRRSAQVTLEVVTALVFNHLQTMYGLRCVKLEFPVNKLPGICV